ncbi:IPT/TIG domain-containing protein [Hymenobacter psychrotolerans]|uniref:IPT/TIG domain-containing protein n=1 Tax=Hymenobacter psychrotolerans DSM 18569 TaxID=1121959 RepID=A0A1M6PGD9_9BACT|nr:IPT/TIG domain-containing protein [Hymenobacter psychrotolerans]SHK06960.1 IPT/TIG domain-containing protein [Hymenobacter psychrotolerans DSM 18569]
MKSFARLLLAASMALPGVSLAQAVPASESQCLLLPLPLPSRATQAALVVEAEVLDARSFRVAGRIYTAHRVRVFSSLKGSAARELQVLTEGGTIGLDQQLLTNTLQLQPGQQGILFLTPSTVPGPEADQPLWAVYGSAQGFIRYDLSTGIATEPFRDYGLVAESFYQEIAAATGQRRRLLQPNPKLEAALRQAAMPVMARGQAPVISGLSPASVPAGVGTVLTISGAGFGTTRGNGFVEFRNADNGGSTFIKPQESEYVSWTDTRIQVRVPALGQPASPAGSGPVRVTTSDQQQTTSPTSIAVPYAVSNVQASQTGELVRPNPVNRNGRGGYSFQFESGFAANTAAVAAWQRALATWRCQTRMNWETAAPLRAGRGAAEDGENSIGFDQGAELPVGILGRTTSYYRGCFRPDGRLTFALHEVDMQFDDGANWQFGPGPAAGLQLDFESVVVHELGHAQQLAHVILPGAVMHYALARAQNNRTISASDVAGGRLVLRTRGFVAQGCGPAPMLPAPLTSLSAGAEAGGIAVSWTTADACFVESFQVQRSRDTTSWQPLATVSAPGLSRYLDAQPLAGLSYYRLRLLHPDGSVAFTAPVPAVGGEAGAAIPGLFPNPVGAGPLRLQYPTTAEGRVSLSVYDAVGRRQRNVLLDIQPGLNVLPLSLAGLSPGWYLLRYLDSEGRTETLPFLKTGE